MGSEEVNEHNSESQLLDEMKSDSEITEPPTAFLSTTEWPTTEFSFRGSLRDQNLVSRNHSKAGGTNGELEME
jgi:hypothetical protein